MGSFLLCYRGAYGVSELCDVVSVFIAPCCGMPRDGLSVVCMI